MDADRSSTNVRVVPDLGDELLIAIVRLEALLGSVAVGEIEDDVGATSPVRRREGAGRPADRGRRGAAGPSCCTSCRYAPLATLEHVPQILVVQRAYCNLNAAVERYAAVLGERPLALVSCLSRTISLLALPWDDDQETRRAGIGKTCDNG